jgi:hypothetical protein
MAEHFDPETRAPQHPPQSVANRQVRRTTLRTYLGPIVIFFIVVAAALAYWSTRPDDDPARREAATARNTPAEEQPAGTIGAEREDTPGGHDPQPAHESTREEIAHRAGDAITELGEVIEEDGRFEIGRRVEVHDVEVERVESPTTIWVRDGNARVAVILPAGRTAATGQQVNIVGVVERAGGSARIRATQVTPSGQ